MDWHTIGILSPGDMGHSVGQVLREHGLRVIACLEGRGARTRALAAAAVIEEVPAFEDLARESDVLLSILVPAEALSAAQLMARAIGATRSDLLYVDCNAIAPQTVREIGRVVTNAGARFVDASIIGGPPRAGYTPRIYVSGPEAGSLLALNDYGLEFRAIDGEIGHASALKMVYATLTKGSTALIITLMAAARALGIDEALWSELELSQKAQLTRIERSVQQTPVKARRWVGEMEEIAATYAAVGLPSGMPAGAADIFRLLGATPLADRTPEDTSPFPSMQETLDALLSIIKSNQKA